MPPLIADLDANSITRSSATISWTTNVPTTSQVVYAPSTFSSVEGPLSAGDQSLVTDHRVIVSGLLPGATYRYFVRSVAAGGGLTVTEARTLITAAAGSGPDITTLAMRQVTGSTATLGWATTTGTVAQVEYGTTANYGSFTLLKLFVSPLQSMTLSSLRPATTYHYRVKAWDGDGYLSASADATFDTAPAGPATLIGDQTIQSERITLAPGQAAAYQFVAAQSGQASLVRLYVDTGTSAPVIRLALYSDVDGGPGTILSQGSAPGLVPGWVDVSIPPVTLLRSTRYWVAVLSPISSSSLNLRQAGLGGSSMTSALTSLAAFPSTWRIGSLGARSPLSVSVHQLAPAVTLTGPTEGSVMTGRTQLSAVVDDDVPLARVDFFVDGVPVGTAADSAGVYSVPWDAAGQNASVPHTISARATDLLGRSGTSALVSVQVDNGPLISGVSMSLGLTARSARVSWQTDVLADGQVEFGPTLAYGSVTPLDARPDWRHDMQLTGLQPGSVYHYRVRSRDANGALAVSADQVFFTPEP